MATTITDLSINKVDMEVGSATAFRENINTNFTNYQTALQDKINNQVKPAVAELQTTIGSWDSTSYGSITNFVSGSPANKKLVDVIGVWDVATWGTIRNRFGSPSTGARVFVADGNAGAVRANALEGDLICEIGTSS